MKDCIFCKIINGDIPSMKVYEDDVAIAYLDINPDSDGHTLIVPKTHYKDLFDIPSDVLSTIFEDAKKIMNILKDKLNCNGFTLVQNNGDIQEVKHFHLHIKPYYASGKVYKKIINENAIRNVEETFDIITK